MPVLRLSKNGCFLTEGLRLDCAHNFCPKGTKIPHLRGDRYVSGQRSRRITWISFYFALRGETLRGFATSWGPARFVPVLFCFSGEGKWSFFAGNIYTERFLYYNIIAKKDFDEKSRRGRLPERGYEKRVKHLLRRFGAGAAVWMRAERAAAGAGAEGGAGRCRGFCCGGRAGIPAARGIHERAKGLFWTRSAAPACRGSATGLQSGGAFPEESAGKRLCGRFPGGVVLWGGLRGGSFF